MEYNPKRVHQQIRNFERCLEDYNFQEPFARFLTQFYKNNKQMGSSDRRMNSRYCYHVFRLGRAFQDLPLQERLVIAEFLCETESAVVHELRPEWVEQQKPVLSERIAFIESLYPGFLNQVFPWHAHLSDAIDKDAFIQSHFVQPHLFIRIQAGKAEQVKKELSKQDISFEAVSPQTLVLANGVNLQALKNIQGLYEVQDWASQQSLKAVEAKPNETWWDCCAASGGKTLMLLDRFPTINVLVSDIRLSILRNLEERFEMAGIKRPFRKKVLDLSQPVAHIMQNERFDGLIIDAPCSGSGTWGRTPEMLSKFQETEIQKYTQLQKQIVKNALPYLKPGKELIYITCSVFKEENEEVVAYISNELNLQLESMTPILGYNHQADSMFTAKFIKI